MIYTHLYQLAERIVEMDINSEPQSDLIERRRLQNRLAQRRYRGKTSISGPAYS